MNKTQTQELNLNDEITIPEAVLNLYDLQNYLSKPMLRLKLSNYFDNKENQVQEKKKTFFAEQVIMNTKRNLSTNNLSDD